MGKSMKKRYEGLDVLRGLGIFFVVALHSAFYYFGGLYDLDLNNPPPIVTIIGLLLMFAGMFAIISGISHFIQFMRRIDKNANTWQILKQFLIRGVIILIIAYAYFIFTGPGIVDMAARSMDNSILVNIIQQGVFEGASFQRIFYVDSLVMLGSNIILLGIFTVLLYRVTKSVQSIWFCRAYFIGGLAVTALSLVRIPLFEIFTKASTDGNYLVFFLLNWLVAKNNPVLPYFAFGLFGMWIGAMLNLQPWKSILRNVLSIGLVFLVAGVVLYIKLPDTMLQRGIDMKWYSIMLAQLGLFMLLVLGALKIFDFRKVTREKLSPVTKFIKRFGVAGLTVFFSESILSACVYRLIKLFIPDLSLDLNQAIIYGLSLALCWGVFLIFWEKSGYKYGLEYMYGKIVSAKGESTKLQKLDDSAKGKA
jgi:uncharacterized membrane protein